MPDLLEEVRRQFDRPLLDKTGLTGSFDFRLDFMAQPPPGMPVEAAAVTALADLDAGPSLVTSLREQLGLRVVPSRERMEILVVNRAKRRDAN